LWQGWGGGKGRRPEVKDVEEEKRDLGKFPPDAAIFVIK